MSGKTSRKLFGLLLLSQLACGTYAADDAEISALKKQLQELAVKVQMLEQQQDKAAVVIKTAPKISLGASGFSFSSADTNVIAQFHGLVQFDSRTFFQGGGLNGNNGFPLLKARDLSQAGGLISARFGTQKPAESPSNASTQ